MAKGMRVSDHPRVRNMKELKRKKFKFDLGYIRKYVIGERIQQSYHQKSLMTSQELLPKDDLEPLRVYWSI